MIFPVCPYYINFPILDAKCVIMIGCFMYECKICIGFILNVSIYRRKIRI